MQRVSQNMGISGMPLNQIAINPNEFCFVHQNYSLNKPFLTIIETKQSEGESNGCEEKSC